MTDTRPPIQTGPIRRFFRCRLRGHRPQRQGHRRGREGAPGRLRLHGQRRRRLQVLLQQRDEHVHGQIRRLRDRCKETTPRRPRVRPIEFDTEVTDTPVIYTYTGRERGPRQPAFQAGLFPRTDLRPRGGCLQALRPALCHLEEPKVLPHSREPQLQHGQEHREAHHQLQSDPVRPDHCHGRSAGLHCQILLPGTYLSDYHGAERTRRANNWDRAQGKATCKCLVFFGLGFGFGQGVRKSWKRSCRDALLHTRMSERRSCRMIIDDKTAGLAICILQTATV